MDNDTVEKIIKRHLLLVKADGLYLEGGEKEGKPWIICSCGDDDKLFYCTEGIIEGSVDLLRCKPGWLTTFKSGGGSDITRVRPRGKFFTYSEAK